MLVFVILEINVLFILRQERQGSGGGPPNLCHLLSGPSENHITWENHDFL